ncbi:hypothetical protein [Tessaracoccus timonensis]|uniref:hypothetical protein n=1 Tax=Tessaracoccus timonensis TaxID=2161816 RepID=UPI000D550484|nr:hypothetical protein [Tessaracoccus timonensis]
MTSTMHTEGPLRVGLVGQQAWASATELITGPELPHVDEDLRDDWAAAGIETPAGLDPQWGIALELTRTAKIALQLVSQYADVVFESSLLVGNQDCVAITQRCKVEDGPDGPEVVGAHPMIEVALAPTAQIWSLIRRVLPPLDDARATPIRPGAGYEPIVVVLENVPDSLRDDPSALLRRVPDMPDLPDDARDALHPEASVFAIGMAEFPDGTHHFNDAWSIGARGLYHMVPGQPGIVRVPAGHLGGSLIHQLADLTNGRA